MDDFDPNQGLINLWKATNDCSDEKHQLKPEDPTVEQAMNLWKLMHVPKNRKLIWNATGFTFDAYPDDKEAFEKETAEGLIFDTNVTNGPTLNDLLLHSLTVQSSDSNDVEIVIVEKEVPAEVNDREGAPDAADYDFDPFEAYDPSEDVPNETEANISPPLNTAPASPEDVPDAATPESPPLLDAVPTVEDLSLQEPSSSPVFNKSAPRRIMIDDSDIEDHSMDCATAPEAEKSTGPQQQAATINSSEQRSPISSAASKAKETIISLKGNAELESGSRKETPKQQPLKSCLKKSTANQSTPRPSPAEVVEEDKITDSDDVAIPQADNRSAAQKKAPQTMNATKQRTPAAAAQKRKRDEIEDAEADAPTPKKNPPGRPRRSRTSAASVNMQKGRPSLIAESKKKSPVAAAVPRSRSAKPLKAPAAPSPHFTRSVAKAGLSKKLARRSYKEDSSDEASSEEDAESQSSSSSSDSDGEVVNARSSQKKKKSSKLLLFDDAIHTADDQPKPKKPKKLPQAVKKQPLSAALELGMEKLKKENVRLVTGGNNGPEIFVKYNTKARNFIEDGNALYQALSARRYLCQGCKRNGKETMLYCLKRNQSMYAEKKHHQRCKGTSWTF